MLKNKTKIFEIYQLAKKRNTLLASTRFLLKVTYVYPEMCDEITTVVKTCVFSTIDRTGGNAVEISELVAVCLSHS
jgi:hypothetical protein